MTEQLSELQIEAQIWKAKAEVWETAYNKLLVRQYANNTSLTLDPSGTDETGIFPNQEQEVIDFIDKEITPKAESGGVRAESIWMNLLFNYLKKIAIDLASKALEHLVEVGTERAIDAADFALEKLQDFLYDKYLMSNDKQKEIFKDKILEKFPQSGLANKLKNE